ncbi:ABC transporter ATP-binding protein [Acuticoccus mangrovi]|uniref:ABC transporter ATP-binding protein n=1 Tax=Acuticoccus mangrovi TaxID=2796142 RepID=A0A934ILT7_9HYPH|nr:ABC transporter ATP-binding protein [Acuticoccus mangrovi]MBJ3774771.1 ABC transporter ATP-binding protein [Acuticoccus mangrovi]
MSLPDTTVPAREVAVKVDGVGMVYPTGTEALRDIAVEFPRGALVSLLGPSGCGKTTLLKIIAGLIEPTRGQVIINGTTVHGPSPASAFVFQDFALMPWATVLRNVAFGLELRGVRKREREAIARKYIAEVGLAGAENRYPHEMSGGMRQRAGLARALAVDADVLLMDEPFSAIDEQMRRKLQEDLLSLLRVEKKTVIFVTHSIEEAVYLSDRIVILSPNPGEVSQVVDTSLAHEGDPETIRRDPRYVALVDEIWSGLKRYLD